MTFEPTVVITVLAEHKVEYILIGGLAALLHGADHVTTDIDITPKTGPENLGRLSAALTDLDARVRVVGEPDGLPFAHDARSLASASIWNLTTRAGDMDISFVPSGTDGFDDLSVGAIVIEIGGVDVPTASLADIVRSKTAADRAKDLAVLPMLRRLLRDQA